MSDACAALVERGDPDRFLSVMAAPPAARACLWPLYAFNLEVARAPWASAEPLIGEMRLQWWIDALDDLAAGRPPRAHEVVTPLAALIARTGLDICALQGMAEARRWDIWSEPFADAAALFAHLDAIFGNLMWAAAQSLGAPRAAEPVVREAAIGMGLAAWLRAAPELLARGRPAWPDMDLGELVAQGQAHLAAARRQRHLVPSSATPALRAGWRADAALRAARHAPDAILTGLPSEPEVARRGRLLWLSLTGRW